LIVPDDVNENAFGESMAENESEDTPGPSGSKPPTEKNKQEFSGCRKFMDQQES
jgi:hypothetical protein